MGLQTNNPALLSELMSSKRALFIGAHPDDIEFYCGGLVYELARVGVSVSYLIATKGGKGRGGKARVKLESLRVRHQKAAAEVLGGACVELMDYPDGRLQEHVFQCADTIRARVLGLCPDFVFCWDFQDIYNPHSDHQAVAEACRDALDGIGVRVVRYGTRRPDFGVGLRREAYCAKMRSLRAHKTETPWYYWPIVVASICARLRRGGRLVGSKHAEVFRQGLR